MKSPLNKRLLRELIKDWRKYIALFFMMAFMIGIASGTFVGNDSMMKSIDEAYEKYNIEYGHFELKDKATEDLVDSFAEKLSEPITVYEQFYKEASESNNSTIRVFKIRKEVNLLCLMGGELPSNDNEIAIDRMHANNQDIKVGDAIRIGGKSFTVSGLIAASDYSTLFRKNSDIMFDAINFDIGFVTDDAWDGIGAATKYQYAFKYDNPPEDEIQEKEMSDLLIEELAVLSASGGVTSDADKLSELFNPAMASASDMEAINPDNINELKDYVPRYANQAINFAPEDLGSDQAMMNVIVYIFISVLAFIFAITTSNKIKEESAVIGTLRATGYTRGELIRFHMLIPVVITLLSSIIGNVLGYTYFKDIAVGMYYNSYSLLKYETVWNSKAFIITTLVPLILIIVINFIVIARLMKLSPLKFLRRDLSTSKRKKAVRLPAWSFFNRFRLRILLQNKLDYLVMFLGIIFIMILLGFAVGLPETLDHYKKEVPEQLIADYQYVLRSNKDFSGERVSTEEPSAEKYSMTTLLTVDGVNVGETISVYGFSENSEYISFSTLANTLGYELSPDGVFISSAYQKKYKLKEGDSLTLKGQYSNDRYSFVVEGIYDYPTSLAVFIPNERFNAIFDKDKDSFTGFFSRKEITDIDEDLIYTVITVDDAMILANQLDHSMGNYMDFVSGACLVIGILLMYLLTKIIIEKNAVSISMIKVLGYEDKEINSLYVRLTTIIIVLISIITAFLSIYILKELFSLVMYRINGWIPLYISETGILKMIGIVLASYLIVSFFDIRHIKRIPLTEALKNVE